MEANNKAMREALDDIGNACAWISANCNDGTGQTQKYMDDIISIVRRALAAPPRQCDIGTAEEQRRRYDEWRNHDGLRAALGKDEFEWAHMPYHESEANNGEVS